MRKRKRCPNRVLVEPRMRLKQTVRLFLRRPRLATVTPGPAYIIETGGRPMPGVFISYRREDSGGYAGRLFDILSAQFGKENLFMDLDTIEGGDDFTAVIEEKINLSDVLIAIIGNRWLTITEGNGKRRLDNTGDFVRNEIAKALERGIRVIPVLVGGAIMPRPDDLPDNLRMLCQRQAVEIRDSHFHPDAQQLTDELHRDVHGIALGQRKPSLNRLVAALLSGVGAIIILAGFLLSHHPKPPPTLPALNPVPKEQIAPSGAPPVQGTGGQPDGTKNSTNSPVDVAGKWNASVKYDWGETYDTTFEFEVDGSKISGMAGYAADRDGDGRAIVDGKIAGNRISFVTKSLVTRGFNEPNVEESHYYDGTVEGGSIRFTLATDSVDSSHSPVKFTAHRVKAGSLRKQ